MNRRISVSPYSLALFSIIAVVLAFSLPYALRATAAHADSNASVVASVTTTVPGAPTAISGSGFAPNETVLVNFGTHSATATADSQGAISGVTLPIPMVPTGLQFISAFGETSGRWGLAYVYVAGFNPQVSPASYYILPGAALSFTGTGFAPNETVTASYLGTAIGSFTTNGAGSFSGAASSSLPLSVSNTTATVSFTGSTSNAQTSLKMTVGQLYPSIAPSSYYTGAGSTISLTGNGFAPNEGISVKIGTQTASSTADSTGSFSIPSITLPKVGGAATAITATGVLSGASVSVSIYVTGVSPYLTFSSYYAQGGSAFTINGNSFAGGEQVGIFSPSGPIGTTTADAKGNFAYVTTTPFAPAGSLTITAIGADSTAQTSGKITIAPTYTNLQLGSYAGAPGTAVNFIGSGYLPNEPIQVTTDRTGSTVVATFTADNTGSFNDSSYVVPANFAEGNLVLTVSGMHSFSQKGITYYVTGK